MGLFSRKRNSTKFQNVCLFPETNNVSDLLLRAGVTDVESEETAEAWGLDSSLQCKDEETGQYFQFISSVICDPIDIFGNGKGLNQTDVSLIASQTEDQEMTFVEQGKNRDWRWLWYVVMIEAVGLVLLGLALVALKYIRGG